MLFSYAKFCFSIIAYVPENATNCEALDIYPLPMFRGVIALLHNSKSLESMPFISLPLGFWTDSVKLNQSAIF